ncbi:MAG TPA: dienelactone hydrolase family protein [Chloroflexota bacterium]|nr:dienelactone hydrolase family protein [Chloroflexota bacterium]
MPDLTVPVPGATELPAYLARPSVGSGPWPGVVLIHDAVGMTTVTREHSDRLATAGYLTLAPDLYSRGGLIKCLVSTLSAVASGQGQAYEDIAASRAWLRQSDQCTGRVGVIGFCMGGGFALMTAAQGFDASAANYGQVPRDLAALNGACPIVASYGAKDRLLGSAGDRLKRALTERNIANDVKTYPRVAHGFMDRYNLGPLSPVLRVAGFGYDHASADDAWGRILRFFAVNLS